MSLSKHERQAWEELERVLAGDLPYTHTDMRTMTPEHSSAAFLPRRVSRILILITLLIGGVSLLIVGALTQLLPMALTGLIILCVATDHLHSPSTHGAPPDCP
ncbi:DUF3040 domain-containing protein [Arthrobacter sp. NamB2]|uniref:DUF3040 domain-containing protein n=1 Tax=Arthrobacter sp. NamB2 TaxID=2576035 RepID=UPI0010C9E1A6|nr:DUF3040 domain-containing protein [Arthrobacter sp. NamB2]TKV26145.1 DUF3040 domain-containing protein [Arthrobacter sp. NamB2]